MPGKGACRSIRRVSNPAGQTAAPKLKVFSTGGYHDIVTPFHLTERDTARLAEAPIAHRYYAGGHMTYLDDAARRRQKADLAKFIRGGA